MSTTPSRRFYGVFLVILRLRVSLRDTVIISEARPQVKGSVGKIFFAGEYTWQLPWKGIGSDHMPSTPDIDDDYATQLLLEDARKTSQKYSRQGLSSFLPDRQSSLRKPNTRFLNNIVRQADQHNAALKRKEEAESELRLRALNQYDHPRKRRRTDEDIGHRRSRLFKDVADAAHSTSQSKEHRRSSPKKSKDHIRYSRHRRSNSRSDRDEDELHNRKRKQKQSESSVERTGHLSTRKVVGSAKTEYDTKLRHQEGDWNRSGRNLSPESSDPLEEVTGLLSSRAKIPLTRGRGSKGQKSNIDGHFSPNYDPDRDITINSDEDEDDWGMALEALRDQAKWKKNQHARLRDAGFREDEISRWKNGALDKDKRSLDEATGTIRWSRKGEARGWDAGKVLD